MTAKDLQQAQRRHETAQARAETARQHRDTVLLAALASGWTQRAAAQALGLSHQMVAKIALRRDH